MENIEGLKSEIAELKSQLAIKEARLAELIAGSDTGIKVSTNRLTNKEISRYSRQIILNEIGVKGQLALKRASVLIVGAGGLGKSHFENT